MVCLLAVQRLTDVFANFGPLTGVVEDRLAGQLARFEPDLLQPSAL